jgi:hypothetical protein
MVESTKAIGMIITNRAKDLRSLAIIRSIKEIMFEGNQKDVDDMSGKMENSTKDSGPTDSSMALGYGEVPREIHTLGSGEKAGPMATECIPGSMETDMRVSLKTASSMVRELNILLMETLTKATMKTASLQVMESTTGVGVVSSKVSLKLVYVVAKASGRKELVELISMRENGTLIRRKVTAYLHGLMGTCTKGISSGI